MNQNLMFLFGIMLFHYTVLEDCTTGRRYESSVFVRASDSIHFNFDEFWPFHDSLEHFTLERRLNGGREQICGFDIDTQLDEVRNEDCSLQYDHRTLVILMYADRDYIILDITISKAEKADNGTYMITSKSSGISKCFTVYILGQPDTEIEFAPPIIDLGTSRRFKCSSTSTTVPGTHNLTIQTSWLVNNKSVGRIGRFQIDGNDLIINYVTRFDNNLTVSCKAVEERGLTTLANITVPIGWGPDPKPKLQPPNIFYNIDPGSQLPNINCSSDCNPPCEVRWEKIDSHMPLSTNGVLSLGKVEKILSGEYVCIATRNMTNKTGRTSVIIFVKEAVGGITKTYTQNYTPVAVVSGVLGSALVAAIVFIIVLFRRGGCSTVIKSSTASKRAPRTAEMELQNTRTNYEGLGQRNNASPTYDELNISTEVAEAKFVSKTTEATGKDVYQNTRINDK